MTTTPLNLNRFHIQPKVYILHEDTDWMHPLAKELKKAGVAYEEWFINEKDWDFSLTPPRGIFFSRISASAHLRHPYAVTFTDQILTWLEMNGRKVINGSKALALEMSKLKQYFALRQFEIKTPRTLAGNSSSVLWRLAQQFEHQSFIFKPNQSEGTTGVRLFQNLDEFSQFLTNYEEIASPDGIYLLQEYIRPVDEQIIRLEFINGKLYDAVSIGTSDLGKPLTPNNKSKKVKLIKNHVETDLELFEIFLDVNGIQIGSIEYLMTENGHKLVYALDTLSYYNPKAIAQFLGNELKNYQDQQEQIGGN